MLKNNDKSQTNNKVNNFSIKYFPKRELSYNWKKLQLKNKNKPTKNKVSTNKRNIVETKNLQLNDKKNQIWFDDVDPCLIESSRNTCSTTKKLKDQLVKDKSFDGLTKFIAMDCEMVGTGFGGTISILARVSLVNLYGHCIYDKFVKPIEKVTDYRTDVSGIRPEDLENGHDFKVVQSEVYEIIKNRILIGHAIYHDLNVLFLSHPKNEIRDTSIYFRRFFNNRTPSLRKLCEIYLGVKIQDGEHDSVIDAQATMRLYTLFKKQWESSIKKTRKRQENNKKLLRKK